MAIRVLGVSHHGGIGAAHHVIQRFDQFLFFWRGEKGANLETIAAMHQFDSFSVPRMNGLSDVNLGEKAFPNFRLIRRVDTGF